MPAFFLREAMELAVKRTGHITKVSEALWAMMDYYEDDTYSEESFETVISGIGTLNTEMAMVEVLLERGDLQAATIRAEAIPTVVRFGKSDHAEYDAFLNWINLRKDMISANRDWQTIDASDRAALEGLLLHFDTYAASQAMEILNAYAGTDYFIPPAFGQKGMLKRQSLSASEINEQLIEVYPNPANYMVNLQLKETLPTQEMCNLLITDMMGREVHYQQVNPALRQLVINTENWAAGMYAFRIVIPHSPIEIHGKFDVVH